MQILEREDGDVVYFPGFFPSPDRDRLLTQVQQTTIWRQETLRMFGKESPIPRLTSWYGDPGCVYTYSKIVMEPEPWTPALLEVKARVEERAGVEFNSVLLNLYRDGHDGVAWHSDDEPELGLNPVICSVSLGATRRFQFRHKAHKQRAQAAEGGSASLRRELDLEHGSVLLMRGSTQRFWQHQVPKTSQAVKPRVNLTFRTISPSSR